MLHCEVAESMNIVLLPTHFLSFSRLFFVCLVAALEQLSLLCLDDTVSLRLFASCFIFRLATIVICVVLGILCSISHPLSGCLFCQV